MDKQGTKSKSKHKRCKPRQGMPAPASMEHPLLFNTTTALSSLNIDVLNHLLLFLDVPALQQLAKTSRFFEQLINGRTITNLKIPFSQEFLQGLQGADVVEKKPVLRITVSEADIGAQLTSQSFCSRNFAISLLFYQLSLLDLMKLRDLVIQPKVHGPGEVFSASCHNSFTILGQKVIQALARFGVLHNLTRYTRYLSNGVFSGPLK